MNMNSKDIIIAILIAIIGASTFAFGRISKKCDPCEILPPVTITKYIKIKHNEKKIEIKRDYEKKIDAIDSADVYQLDSIWSEYAKRYGKDTAGGL